MDVLFFSLQSLFAYDFFLSNKDVQQKVRDEIFRVLGDDLTPNMEQHKELKYMNMVINENLRLYPPVCIIEIF
jgi:cytochrome P450